MITWTLKPLFKATLITAIITILTGCLEGLPQLFTEPKPNPQKESFAEFVDVPYPTHLIYNRRESYTFKRRNKLYGLVTVSGKMNLDEAGDYFDAHLPGHGWQPRAKVSYSLALVSTWTKGDQTLTVVGRPAALTLTSEIRLELWVAPLHTADDLNQRVIYQPPTSGTEAKNPAKNTLRKGISEEDI
ncbi:MAG: hypothetical protein AMR96_03935 [Candidatus Adiutrix intracellularis]|jgi:hypothetical protein|nr:MAG: hypothetical protein AMR96_03935 [Candidatus Adiutrix intracellularis]MDR2826964.1 hypothetical protein [Candidatus Adiutrix intracellularis]